MLLNAIDIACSLNKASETCAYETRQLNKITTKITPNERVRILAPFIA